MEIRSQKPAETTLGRVALKAGAWYLISQIIIRGLTFLTTPIFTRLLSTDQYGVVRVYESWIDMLLPVFGLCIYQSMSRAKLDMKMNTINTLPRCRHWFFFSAAYLRQCF